MEGNALSTGLESGPRGREGGAGARGPGTHHPADTARCGLADRRADTPRGRSAGRQRRAGTRGTRPRPARGRPAAAQVPAAARRGDPRTIPGNPNTLSARTLAGDRDHEHIHVGPGQSRHHRHAAGGTPALQGTSTQGPAASSYTKGRGGGRRGTLRSPVPARNPKRNTRPRPKHNVPEEVQKDLI